MVRFAALGVTEKVTDKTGEKVTDKNCENAVINSIYENSTEKKVTDKTSEKVTNRVTDKEIANDIDKVTDVVLRKTTKKEYQVLVALSENPTASYAELAEKFGVSKKTIVVWMKSLRGKQLLVREGNNKKGYWRIVLY